MPKLGKLPAEIDERTIPLTKLLVPAKLPPIPYTYDAVDSLRVVDNYTFNNLMYGDCVIAARAHQTLIFEKFEQGLFFLVSDEEVVAQYFLETGGLDTGLVMLRSLNRWRKEGWRVDNQTYRIHAFAGVDWKDVKQTRQAIYLLRGLQAGMRVPRYAMEAFDNKVYHWELQTGNNEILGGHAIYVTGYNAIGPRVMTWGQRVQMTWAFWLQYIDECYAIVDDKDLWLGENSQLDVTLLDHYLREIAGPPIPDTPEVPPSLWERIWQLIRSCFGK